MAFLSSFDISASGMSAQRMRMAPILIPPEPKAAELTAEKM